MRGHEGASEVGGSAWTVCVCVCERERDHHVAPAASSSHGPAQDPLPLAHPAAHPAAHSAAAPVAVAAAPAGGGDEAGAGAEKDSFDVVLADAGSQKMCVG